MKTKLFSVLTLVFLLMIQVSFAQSASESPKITKLFISYLTLFESYRMLLF